jgi:hypothetical protein
MKPTTKLILITTAYYILPTPLSLGLSLYGLYNTVYSDNSQSIQRDVINVISSLNNVIKHL